MDAPPRAMRRRYSAARARPPRKRHGTFMVPVDMGEEAFAALRLQKVKRFLDAHAEMGWQAVIDASHPIQIRTGAYPAYDIREEKYRTDVREYVVSAWFVLPNPKPLRIELPDWFTAGLVTPQPEKG